MVVYPLKDFFFLSLSSLHSEEISPLLDTYFMNILQSFACLFSYFNSVLQKETNFNFDAIQFIFFFFYDLCFWVLRNFCLNKGNKDFFL